MTFTVRDEVTDEIVVWLDVMTNFEVKPLQVAAPAGLVAAGLAHFSLRFVASRNTVGEAIDRVAALKESPHRDSFDSWDARRASDVGKQGYRGDAVALLIGFGLAVETATRDLITSGVDQYVAHADREGAAVGDRTSIVEWAQGAAKYVSDPAAASAATHRLRPLGWDES